MGLRGRIKRFRNVLRRASDAPSSAAAIAPAPTPRETYLAISELLRRAERPDDPPVSLDLGPYELKVFSQNGEDGILAEILRRVGSRNRTFVELGSGSGVEAICVYLADVAGWHGHFIEGDPHRFRALAAKYECNGRVSTTNAFLTPANVESLLDRLELPEEFDVLSIDVDSHDYWIWKAVSRYQPRIVVVEYNAALGIRCLTKPLDSDPHWRGTDYFGASITALNKLAGEKGYRLVHCDLTGVNAFFVRADAGGSFTDPGEVTLRAPNYGLRGHRHVHEEGPYEAV